MSNIIKKTIQEQLHKKALAAYEAELDRQKNSWRKQLKKGIPVGDEPHRLSGTPFFVIPFSKAGEESVAEAEHSGCKWILFAADDGCFAPEDPEELENRVVGASHHWIYFDEDLYTPEGNGCEGVRCYPWLKPDASPDTLLSCFYLGGIITVRTGAAKNEVKTIAAENVPEAEKNGFAFVYRMCLNLMHNDPVYIHEAAFCFTVRSKKHRRPLAIC